MVESKTHISILRQCELLDIKRSSYYYKPVDKMKKYDKVKELIVYIWNDNPARGHQSLELRTPEEVYYKKIENRKIA